MGDGRRVAVVVVVMAGGTRDAGSGGGQRQVGQVGQVAGRPSAALLFHCCASPARGLAAATEALLPRHSLPPSQWPAAGGGRCPGVCLPRQPWPHPLTLREGWRSSTAVSSCVRSSTCPSGTSLRSGRASVSICTRAPDSPAGDSHKAACPSALRAASRRRQARPGHESQLFCSLVGPPCTQYSAPSLLPPSPSPSPCLHLSAPPSLPPRNRSLNASLPPCRPPPPPPSLCSLPPPTLELPPRRPSLHAPPPHHTHTPP